MTQTDQGFSIGSPGGLQGAGTDPMAMAEHHFPLAASGVPSRTEASIAGGTEDGL